MINKFFAFLVFSVLILNSVGSALAGTGAKSGARGQTGNALAALLPASDMALTFDAKRFFDSALPQVLATNQPLLTGMTNQLDEIKTTVGIDLRQFEEIAVGINVKKLPGAVEEYDIAPVVLARGAQINAGALTSLLKLSGDKSIRQEKIAGRTVYTLDIDDTKLAKKKPVTPPEKKDDAIDRAIDRAFSQISVTAFDANTLAFGTPARVRQVLTTKIHLAPDVSALLNRNPTAILSMAAKVPAGLSKLLPLDNDELGKNIESIKYFFGSADVTGSSAKISLSVKTLTEAQAQSLLDVVTGLQGLGKMVLGNGKTEEKQVYGRMLDNVKLSRKLTEVSLDLEVPQADIDVLVREKKKPVEVPNAGEPAGM